ncbi:3'-5' exoribonuclease YhaM [Polystyrenella longa]|uniref:3'-5' exoribonuclease YhaM n=1 Tax=Polystyrenella longa TaxID=2528007 RepID=A0A518CL57_9PLAN|nr:HD domain-containing protein [Polystyrenella longa]QDU79957.1 3'-5' exoribonuclease YhaM [Polystyrenella longa]
MTMTRRYVQDLQDGETIEEVFLLVDKQLRANRNADLYLLATMRDKTGIINGLMWNVSEESMAQISAGDHVQIKGKVQLYQGSLQVIVTRITKVASDNLDPEDFQPTSSQNVSELLEQLKSRLLGIDDPQLRSLMECFLIDEDLMDSFSRAPAGVKAHHAYQGGLLEHVVRLMEMAWRIGDLYPEVDTNLLLAGVFLHDLGKVREMAFEGAFTYTDEGQLIGHLVIGVEMINEKVAEVEKLTNEPFPVETALRLKHLVLSHHGQYDYGSPKLPMTPEAIALHHLDNFDAKVHEFARSIEDDPNTDSHWTPFSPRLDRKLFKGAN